MFWRHVSSSADRLLRLVLPVAKYIESVKLGLTDTIYCAALQY
jgi:hypothetical protein